MPICSHSAYWSKVLSCELQHVCVYHLPFKLQCSAFDSYLCLMWGMVTASLNPFAVEQMVCLTLVQHIAIKYMRYS